MEERSHTLHKAERLHSKIMIESLFVGGNKSFPSSPLRVVYKYLDAIEGQPKASVLISVPKKRLKHAVKRNRIKRQIREAYRKHKYILLDELAVNHKRAIIAFIWIDDKLHHSEDVDDKVKRLLFHIAENIK